ncbi:Holliday junction resolvase RuvX, partial [Candidatus Peregrinibacteria bacterium CG_4_9_14_0_8_um_filter_44_15]
QAERALIDKGLKKFSEIDEIAAQIILQAWIDRKNNEK